MEKYDSGAGLFGKDVIDAAREESSERLEHFKGALKAIYKDGSYEPVDLLGNDARRAMREQTREKFGPLRRAFCKIALERKLNQL